MSFRGKALGTSVFGSGDDGDVTISSGTTTLSRDMYYNSLVVDSGATLAPAGYRIFVRKFAIINGTVQRNGVSATSFTGASALANGTLGSSSAGGTGNLANGAAGSALGSGVGVAGGAGGTGASGSGGLGGTVTAVSATQGGSQIVQAAPYNILGVIAVSTTRFNSSSGGGGGGGDSTNRGGGGGSGAGLVLISARHLSGSGSINAIGGAGFTPTTGNCGGGGGGGGGVIVLLTGNDTTLTSLTLSVAGGTPGSGVGTGTAGAAGTAGRIILVPAGVI